MPARAVSSPHLTRHDRMARRESTIHGPGLAVHVACLVTCEERRYPGDLFRLPSTTERIQLPDLALLAHGTRVVEHRLRHPRLDEARTHGVHPDTFAGQLP